MEMGCIGFLLGALVCLVFTGIGVCFGRIDKKQPDSDSDVNIYVPMRHRNRGGNKRVHQFSNQEMIFVLHNLKRLTHGWERDIVDAMIEEKEGSISK